MSGNKNDSITTKGFLDHAPVCNGKLTCAKCGRPGCVGCLGVNEPINTCLYCRGLYTEKELSLRPIPTGWDE